MEGRTETEELSTLVEIETSVEPDRVREQVFGGTGSLEFRSEGVERHATRDTGTRSDGTFGHQGAHSSATFVDTDVVLAGFGLTGDGDGAERLVTVDGIGEGDNGLETTDRHKGPDTVGSTGGSTDGIVTGSRRRLRRVNGSGRGLLVGDSGGRDCGFGSGLGGRLGGRLGGGFFFILGSGLGHDDIVRERRGSDNGVGGGCGRGSQGGRDSRSD